MSENIVGGVGSLAAIIILVGVVLIVGGVDANLVVPLMEGGVMLVVYAAIFILPIALLVNAFR